MEKLFKLKENGTDVRTEVLAGITTFMTMAYILAINPSMLSAAGMDATAVLIATCLSAFFGTMCYLIDTDCLTEHTKNPCGDNTDQDRSLYIAGI